MLAPLINILHPRPAKNGRIAKSFLAIPLAPLAHRHLERGAEEVAQGVLRAEAATVGDDTKRRVGAGEEGADLLKSDMVDFV